MRKYIVIFSLLLPLILGAVVLFPARAQSGMLPGNFYDDREPLFTYAGTWVQSESTDYFQGTRTYTDTLNSTVLFTFTGTGFTLYTITTAADIRVDLCIDGACGEFSLQAGTPAFRAPIQFTGMTFGIHHISMRKVANSQRFSFDGIFIHTISADPITVELTVPPIQITVVPDALPHRTTWQVAGQDVAFDYVLTSGDISSVIFMGFLVLLALIFLIMRVFGWGGRKREL